MVRKGIVLIYFVNLIITIFPSPSLQIKKEKNTNKSKTNKSPSSKPHTPSSSFFSYICMIVSFIHSLITMLLCGDILGFELFCGTYVSPHATPRPSSLHSSPHHTMHDCHCTAWPHCSRTTTRPFHGFPICFDEIQWFVERVKTFNRKSHFLHKFGEGAIFVWAPNMQFMSVFS